MLPIRCLVFRTRAAVVTSLLVAANGLVFLFELWLGPALPRFISAFGLYPVDFTLGAINNDFRPWLGVFTSMFLHGGWMHLAGNMLFLWVFGSAVEDRLGRLRYLALYVGAGAIAGVSQVLATPYALVPTIGASGAVAGVLGAYLFLFPHTRVRSLVFVVVFLFFWDIPAALFLLVWFAFQLLSGTLMLEHVDPLAGGIAYFAHVGGFLAGCVLAIAMRAYTPRRPVYVWRGAFGRPYYTR